MIQHKIKVKGIVLISTLLILILFSNISAFTGNNPLMRTDNSTVPLYEESPNIPKTAAYNLTDDITGEGINQTARIYMRNQSRSEDNGNGYFEIPAPASDMYLDKGDFIFEFDNNYTTEYIIEDDSALNPFKSFLIIMAGSYHFFRIV